VSFFVTLVHIFTCLLLIAVVLLQHGKGADVGAAFGSGASQTVFGARGAGNFLTRLTTSAAVIFMVTSLALSYFTNPPTVVDLLEDQAESALIPAPTEEEAPESTFPEPAPIQEESEGAPSGFESVPLPGDESAPEQASPPPEPPEGG
jgi:preprotein translocase subunit SecG